MIAFQHKGSERPGLRRGQSVTRAASASPCSRSGAALYTPCTFNSRVRSSVGCREGFERAVRRQRNFRVDGSSVVFQWYAWWNGYGPRPASRSTAMKSKRSRAANIGAASLSRTSRSSFARTRLREGARVAPGKVTNRTPDARLCPRVRPEVSAERGRSWGCSGLKPYNSNETCRDTVFGTEIFLPTKYLLLSIV